VNLASINIERLSRFISGHRATFVFKSQRAFQDVARQRTGMGAPDFRRRKGISSRAPAGGVSPPEIITVTPCFGPLVPVNPIRVGPHIPTRPREDDEHNYSHHNPHGSHFGVVSHCLLFS
jgi:hypothetical protein